MNVSKAVYPYKLHPPYPHIRIFEVGKIGKDNKEREIFWHPQEVFVAQGLEILMTCRFYITRWGQNKLGSMSAFSVFIFLNFPFFQTR